ncbi:DUF4386 domain-containing protein [Helicovermis profundi]|uniref:DUF4386 domain-containing protein n=1 Tax=Helicovermis profundi TaxID=3065157 RepID=UPI0030CC8D46
MGITRLLYSIFLTFAISKLIYLSQTIDIRTAYSAITLIEKFNSIWSFDLIIFGCHLIALGLTFKATKLPRLISILLVIGGVGYIIVETLHIIILSYSNIVRLINTLFMIPMTFGELGFGVWLFVKSNKLKSLFGTS